MKIILVLIAGGLGAVSALWLQQAQISDCKKQTRELRTSLAALRDRPAPTPPAPVEPPIEVADVMAVLQRHANKLYFAGRFENWQLADFYVEEIEETAKAFSKKNVMHGQINISGLMGGLILPEVVELEQAVNAQDARAFRDHYHALIKNCNACHTAANLPFIVINEPRTPALDNQQFEPVAAARVTATDDAILPRPR